jgi:hypothetical protein
MMGSYGFEWDILAGGVGRAATLTPTGLPQGKIEVLVMSPGHFQSVRQCDALALQELSLFDIQRGASSRRLL